MMHSYIGINVPEINCFDVLILVLMDDALVRRGNCRNKNRRKVLILVLMDDALVLTAKVLTQVTNIASLNPCFNG